MKKVHSNFLELMVTSSNFYVLSGQDIQFTVMYDTEKSLKSSNFLRFCFKKKKMINLLIVAALQYMQVCFGFYFGPFAITLQ